MKSIPTDELQHVLEGRLVDSVVFAIAFGTLTAASVFLLYAYLASVSFGPAALLESIQSVFLRKSVEEKENSSQKSSSQKSSSLHSLPKFFSFQSNSSSSGPSRFSFSSTISTTLSQSRRFTRSTVRQIAPRESFIERVDEQSMKVHNNPSGIPDPVVVSYNRNLGFSSEVMNLTKPIASAPPSSRRTGATATVIPPFAEAKLDENSFTIETEASSRYHSFLLPPAAFENFDLEAQAPKLVFDPFKQNDLVEKQSAEEEPCYVDIDLPDESYYTSKRVDQNNNFTILSNEDSDEDEKSESRSIALDEQPLTEDMGLP